MTDHNLAAIDALLARVPDYRCESQRKAAPELRAAVVALLAEARRLDAEAAGLRCEREAHVSPSSTPRGAASEAGGAS